MLRPVPFSSRTVDPEKFKLLLYDSFKNRTNGAGPKQLIAPNHGIFRWLHLFHFRAESKDDAKGRKINEFPTLEDHLRTVKNLCEPSKKAPKPKK
jgi:hypothetical protein